MAYTQASSVSVDQAAYDRLAYFALRSELLFDQAADVQATNQAMPGSSVIFMIFSELAAATATLTETSDVTPVAMADSQVTVTLAEYGTLLTRQQNFVEQHSWMLMQRQQTLSVTTLVFQSTLLFKQSWAQAQTCLTLRVVRQLQQAQ